jgi:hypothetical protein
MPRLIFVFCLSLLTLASSGHAQNKGFESLFDGRSLIGWEGNLQLFRVLDDAIVGGTLDNPIAVDAFLCTIREFGDFELRLDARMGTGQIAGVSFRGQRVPASTQVGGYQADMGFIPGEFMPIVSDLSDVDPNEPYPLWGSLLDEYRPDTSRYPDPANPYRLIAVANRSTVDGVLKPGDWNSVGITAVGRLIRLHLNGSPTIEFNEQDDVPQSGVICLQIHSAPPSQAFYRNIRIRQIR